MARQEFGRRDPAKEKYWRGVIKRWERSGQTITGFCRQSQVSAPSFQWWRRELARRDGHPLRLLRKHRSVNRVSKQPARSTCPPFVPVELTDRMPNRSTGHAIEIELPSGHLVRVSCDVSGQAVTTVVKALEAVAC